MHNKFNISLSRSEEDYIKILFSLQVENKLDKIGTNQIAEAIGVSPASANGMLKKLKSKGMVSFEKYGSIELTGDGRSFAIYLIRKHRLWETFLFEKLGFSWDEVHEVAEQLEHIKSKKLVARLEEFLEYPKTDPHGDLIPDKYGNYPEQYNQTLAKIELGKDVEISSVNDVSEEFLKYLSSQNLILGAKLKVVNRLEFDNTVIVEIEGLQLSLSEKFAKNIYVK